MSSKAKLIIVNAGLDPTEPMMDWDRDKASVTDKDGNIVGYIDMNDGMAIRIWLYDRGESEDWLSWSGGRYPDDSLGNVIAAYADGTIMLDDGIMTWNPLRALRWLHDHPKALAGDGE